MLKRVAIFATADELSGPDELAAAHRIGRLLGENDIALVYDGVQVGARHAAAVAAAGAGGRIVGILLNDGGQTSRPDLTERRDVETIEGWRTEVAALVDAAVALPGGFTTLEAAFEVMDWAGASRERPLGLYDAAEYYSALLRTASDEVVDRFVRESQRGLLVVSANADELLRRLSSYRPPETRRDTFFDDD